MSEASLFDSLVIRLVYSDVSPDRSPKTCTIAWDYNDIFENVYWNMS